MGSKVVLRIVIAVTIGGSCPIGAAQDLWQVPLLATDNGMMSSHIVRLSDTAREILGTNATYWEIVASGIPDYGYPSTGIDELLPVTMATFWGHNMQRYAEPGRSLDASRAWYLWYASWGSSDPQDVGCGRQAELASNGESVWSGLIPICDEFCAEVAFEPSAPTEIWVTPTTDSTLVRWPAVPHAESYGVLVWSARPSIDDLSRGLLSASVPITAQAAEGSAVLPPSTGAPLYIGVWARSITPATTMCSEYVSDGRPYYAIHARYALEILLVPDSPRATNAEYVTWAKVKEYLKAAYNEPTGAGR